MARARAPFWGLVAIPLMTLSACDASSDPTVAAQVGMWTLSSERVADLLVLAQPLPLDSLTVEGLVDHWVSMAALAQRMAAGADLNGPEALEVSLWLENREALLDAERRARLADEVQVSSATAEEVFGADTLMLLAHVLRRVDASTSAAERDLQLRTAEEILQGLIAGGGWDAAVAQSEDVETSGSSGLLGLLHLDALPPTLRAAAEQLQPGQVSSVLEGPEGFHILHRPRYEDVSVLFGQLLTDRLLELASVEADRRFLAEIEVAPTEEAPGWVREWASGRLPDASGPAVRWQGGEMPVDVLKRYVTALPADARARLSEASDEAAREFLVELVLREARLAAASEAGMTIEPEARAGLMQMHATDVADWQAALSESGSPLSPEALDAYMERLVARRVALKPVPPLLRDWLLSDLDWSVDRATLAEAVETAEGLIAATGAG